MVGKIRCPYCSHEYQPEEICEPEKNHEEECPSCGKYYIATVDWEPFYSSYRAPCLNGGEHVWNKVKHYPSVWPEWERCIYCGEERGR